MIDLGTPAAAPGGAAGEFEREAAYIAMLYERLDDYAAGLRRRLAEVRLAPPGGPPQARTERDVLARQLERRLDTLAIGDLPLCFGRLDLETGDRLYVGRVGLAGDGDDPFLMDWRAPKAALFYSATAGSSQGVTRRRHFMTRGRQLVSIDDEVFDLESLPEGEMHELRGDAALLAALSRQRTGHMRDIVATIQREQDEIIRSDLAGTLVVQGGPGTGKTAVALHRAAYLLYTHRMRLASSGVLVMGPNPVFLRYIEQVLPSLGEAGVRMATARSLFPGVRTARHDEEPLAALKGSPVMADLLANAIRDRKRRPREAVEIAFERVRIVLPVELLERGRERGLRSRHPHNQARLAVEASLLDAATALFRQERVAIGLPVPGPRELNEARNGLRRTRVFRALMERMWPVLSPQQLLNDLFGNPPLLRSAARGLDLDPALLYRERVDDPDNADWTVEDVALLDAAAELLGSWTDAADQRAARRRAAARREEVETARSALRGMDLTIDVDAEQLVDRFAAQDTSTLAERAARDRTWRYGHVIVDEAQELSPMAWSMVFRRAPDRSMTVVGDLAQCGATWAASSWQELLEPFARGRWRLVELSTNYRSPKEIMEVANAVLAVASPGTAPTVAIRSTGEEPTSTAVAVGTLLDAVPAAAAALVGALGEGRLAVIAPDALLPALAEGLRARLGSDFDEANPLGAAVALVDVAEVKGLEFDAVLLVEPAAIAAHSPRGLNDLYVALTRATRRLAVLHEEPLPSVLAGTLDDRPSCA